MLCLAEGLFTVTRLNGLETKDGKAHEVQRTRIVVIVDDEHQRPRRHAPRVMVHGVTRGTCDDVEIIERRRTRLLEPNAPPQWYTAHALLESRATCLALRGLALG